MLIITFIIKFVKYELVIVQFLSTTVRFGYGLTNLKGGCIGEKQRNIEFLFHFHFCLSLHFIPVPFYSLVPISCSLAGRLVLAMFLSLIVLQEDLY